MTAPRWRIGLALSVLWVVWGSTYLAVSWVLPAVPPLALSAARFAVAAPLMALGALATGAPRPTARELGSAGLVGLLLFLGGNGGTVSSQAYLPSGLTAVMVGLVPLWLVGLGWVWEREAPHPRRLLGVGLGVAGVAGLVGGLDGRPVHPVGLAAVIVGTFAWSNGTMLARRLVLPRSLAWSTAAQMGAGSLGLTAAAGLAGQLGQVHLERLDAVAVGSFVWLVLGGSVAAVVAYNWLLRVTSPAVATTYAYVNPLVAVWLGWWLGGEEITAVELGCSLVIVGAVALVTTARR